MTAVTIGTVTLANHLLFLKFHFLYCNLFFKGKKGNKVVVVVVILKENVNISNFPCS